MEATPSMRPPLWFDRQPPPLWFDPYMVDLCFDPYMVDLWFDPYTPPPLLVRSPAVVPSPRAAPTASTRAR
eukprot:2722949-Prymnesium_polylepis.1